MGFTVFHQPTATEWLSCCCHAPDLISLLFPKMHQNLPTSAVLISLPTVVDGESHFQNTVDFTNLAFHSIKKCQFHFLNHPHNIGQEQLKSYVTSDLYTQVHFKCIYIVCICTYMPSCMNIFICTQRAVDTDVYPYPLQDKEMKEWVILATCSSCQGPGGPCVLTPISKHVVGLWLHK